MQNIKPLRTTDGLKDNGLLGKRWSWKDEGAAAWAGDLILKANYSIQDFNTTIEEGFTGAPKDVIYLIVLTTWIKDAYWLVKSKCLRDDVVAGFGFSKAKDLERCRNYIDAVRSAVVAHPLNTDKHESYGFGPDGRICVDIRGKSALDSFPGAVIRRITFDGVVEDERVEKDDIVLATCPVFPNGEGKLRFERYCLSICDVRDAAEMYVDALYELDRYVSRLRGKDFE